MNLPGDLAGKDDLPSIGGNVDEAAATRSQVRLFAKFGYVDIAVQINLEEGEE